MSVGLSLVGTGWIGVYGAIPPLRTADKIRILFVEDDLSLRKLLSRLLRMEGYEVVEARDGLEAMEYLGEHRVDLVVTDLCMPRMDGGELIAWMERCEVSVPVIVVSGECDVWERFHLYGRRNLHRFLLKPVTVSVLLGEVRDVLRELNFDLSKIDSLR